MTSPRMLSAVATTVSSVQPWQRSHRTSRPTRQGGAADRIAPAQSPPAAPSRRARPRRRKTAAKTAQRKAAAAQGQMGLQLRRRQGRGQRRDAQPARRQGRQPRRDGQSRPAGAARLHHHDRGLHLFLRQPARPIRRSSRRRSRPALAQVGKLTGKSFGDPQNPLLVSVRSGARASMPGMMDTVLNLGLNDATVEALAKKSRRPPLRL